MALSVVNDALAAHVVDAIAQVVETATRRLLRLDRHRHARVLLLQQTCTQRAARSVGEMPHTLLLFPI